MLPSTLTLRGPLTLRFLGAGIALLPRTRISDTLSGVVRKESVSDAWHSTFLQSQRTSFLSRKNLNLNSDKGWKGSGSRPSRRSASSQEQGFDMEGPLVSSEWLRQNLGRVKVLDASWYMPAEGRNPREEFQGERIPGALFFDIDEIADHSTNLPHMLPSEEDFSRSVSKLGLNADDLIVIYDKKGIFSAARAWWTFRVFGHQNIKILEGGFPTWKSLNFEIETTPFNDSAVNNSDYKAKLNPNLVHSFDQILENLEKDSFQVVDARPKERFLGVADEPRKGVKKGHIPNSFNVPFPQVLTENGFLKNENEIRSVFENSGLSLERNIVASCGTGVTACILALALYKIGKQDVPVYDGSWTEWGTRPDAPIQTS